MNNESISYKHTNNEGGYSLQVSLFTLSRRVTRLAGIIAGSNFDVGARYSRETPS